MSDLHPTFTDKDRGPDGSIREGNTIGLIEDGDYHWFSILDKRDGAVKRAVIVPDGVYLVEFTVGGKILADGPTDIDAVLVRYHFKDGILQPTGKDGEFEDGEVGEQFHDVTGGGPIQTNRRVGRWFGTYGGNKIVVRAGSSSSTEAHAVGLDYRVDGGRYARDTLILKFVRQRDE